MAEIYDWFYWDFIVIGSGALLLMLASWMPGARPGAGPFLRFSLAVLGGGGLWAGASGLVTEPADMGFAFPVLTGSTLLASVLVIVHVHRERRSQRTGSRPAR